jgi:predicted alpha-1,6-mannanase (GH76 family)
MASRQTYLGYAEAAAQVLTTKWFPADGPTNWVNNAGDFWRAPNLVTALTGPIQITGSRSYLATAANARAVFGRNFIPGSSPDYYDDECWWGACFLRLGALTGDATWIATADQIFADLQGGWDSVAGGGVWWKRDPKQYLENENEKGSIENELYMDIAMGLYAAYPAGGRQTYLSATNQTWQWMQALIDSTGLVWGSLNQDGTIKRSNVARPYNQGVVLGPLWALFKLAGDAAYLDSAQKIVQAAIDTMTWPDGILREVCEQRRDCGPNDLDSPLFKGIFVRYLAEFAQRLATVDDPARRKAAQQYVAFLQQNADAVWANFPGGIFGMDWHTPQPDYRPTGVLLYDGSLQSSALDLFVAAALVSA